MTPSEHKQRATLALEAANAYQDLLSSVTDADGVPQLRRETMGMPLEAATDADTLGTLSGTLVAQRALQLFKYKQPMLSRLIMDYSDVPAVKGQTVSTRKITAPAVQTYDPALGADGRPNGWSTASGATTVDVNVTLDELVGIPIPFSMATMSSTNRALFAEAAPAAMYSLAKYFVEKVYALCTTENFSAYAVQSAKVPVPYVSYAVALVDFARSKVADIGAAFDFNEVPDEDRSIALIPNYYAKGTTDPSLVNFFAGQQAPEIVTRGILPTLNDFALFKAGNFPQTNNRVGFAFQKNALIGVTKVPSDYSDVLGGGAKNGSVTQVTDPETGLSVLLIQYADHTRGYAEMIMAVLLGAGVGDKRAGLVLTN